MKRLYCMFFGHRYYPFPASIFASIRCHRCGHQGLRSWSEEFERDAAMQRHPAGKRRGMR